MEIHFPHLTNGIAPVRPTRRHRAKTFRKFAISAVITLAAIISVFSISSANAKTLFGTEAEKVIVYGLILHVEQDSETRSYTVISDYKLHHCTSYDDDIKIEVYCKIRD